MWLAILTYDCGVKFIIRDDDMKRLPELIKEQEKENEEELKRYNRIMKDIADRHKQSREVKNKKYDSEM